MSQKILKNSCKWLEGKGILTALTALDVPWSGIISGQPLDDDYYGNRSGSKVLSSLAETLSDNDGKLDTTATSRLANIIFYKYIDNWNKAYEALTIEYNPIHNYDGLETYTETHETTEDIDRDKTDGYTKTNTGTQGVSGTNTGTQGVSGSNTGTQATVEDTTDNITHGFTSYKEKTTYGKTETQNKTFPEQRNTVKTIDGSHAKTHTVDANNPYYTDVKTANKGYHQDRFYGLGSEDSVPSNESKTLFGSSNGTDPSIGDGVGGGNYNETKTIEGGQYSDTDSYTDYSETVTESGSERVVSADTGNDSLEITGSKSDNEDRDSTVTRTDNLAHTETRTDNLAHNETRTDNLSETNSGTESEDISKTGSETIEHTLESSGNYGMTTTQKMITEEIELRAAYNFFDSIVFPDIDKVMVLNNFEENGIYY